MILNVLRQNMDAMGLIDQNILGLKTCKNYDFDRYSTFYFSQWKAFKV